jgi:hypothetical protein
MLDDVGAIEVLNWVGPAHLVKILCAAPMNRLPSGLLDRTIYLPYNTGITLVYFR